MVCKYAYPSRNLKLKYLKKYLRQKHYLNKVLIKPLKLLNFNIVLQITIPSIRLMPISLYNSINKIWSKLLVLVFLLLKFNWTSQICNFYSAVHCDAYMCTIYSGRHLTGVSFSWSFNLKNCDLNKFIFFIKYLFFLCFVITSKNRVR